MHLEPTCACVVGVQDELVVGGSHLGGLVEAGVHSSCGSLHSAKKEA